MNIQNVLEEAFMTSLRSLASELGLSVTTVSRALDGYEDVAVATRERVSRAAAAAGIQRRAACARDRAKLLRW